MPPPTAIAPIYTTTRANEPLTIWSGRMHLSAGGRASGRGELILSWVPAARLRFSIAGRLTGLIGDIGRLTLWGAGTRCPVVVTSAPMLPVTSGSVSGVANPTLEFGGNPKVRRLIAHIPNFPDFVGKRISFPTGAVARGRAELVAGIWAVTIDSRSETRALIEDARDAGGSALTHVAAIERSDGREFKARSASDLLVSLGYCLSFAAGTWTFPQLVTGLDASGAIVYRNPTVARASSWAGRFRWFDEFQPESLGDVFSALIERRSKPEWREPIDRLIYMYVEANDRPPDVGITLAQAALEHMAWLVLVNDRRLISEEGFGKLAAADQLRLLVATLGIPYAMPGSLPALASLTRPGKALTDGPDRITYIRNAFMHPPRGGRRNPASSEVVVDAWKLSLWYVELGILALLGFRQGYRNRLEGGDRQRVPWP
jgi:hypothetical protein